MKSFLTDDGPDASRSATLLRLLLLPAIIGFIFFGGVYWLRLHLTTGGGTPEQAAVVQVHLMQRPDPVPIPVNQATQSTASGPSSPVSGPTEAPAAISNQAPAALPAEAPAASEPVAPSASPRATRDLVSDPATLAFRSELLRHIARFQRYPKAAERAQLQGTVDAVFSIGRNGKLLGVWVKTSSGQAVLDQAAIDTIRRAQPLPPIPTSLPDSLKIEVALGFDPS